MAENKTKKRVLIVTRWFPSRSAPGTGIFVFRDVAAIASKYDVTVVHLGEPHLFESDLDNELTWAEFKVIRVPVAFASGYKSAFAARKIIAQQLHQADLLQTITVGAVTPLIGMRVRVPWVHTEHWSAMLRPPHGTLREKSIIRLLRAQLLRADAVVAVSSYLGEAIQKYSRKPVRVIGNQVTMPDTVYADTPWDFGTIRMLGVSNLTASKHPELAVCAVAQLAERGYDARLRWAGSGSMHKKLVTLAAKLGVADRVEFLGQLDAAQLAVEYNRANIFVLPTEFETFGIALAEAAVAGLPVVTGDTGAFVEFLDPASTEFVPVAEYHQNRIAAAVGGLLSRTNLPTRAQIAARARARFDESDRVGKYFELYDGLLAARKNRARR
ncbi:glycosyltransferase family 4 protein [Canibacter sp. lx-45]|uniref:glycosyltransferase family 4 protein n=1 Tax=Canibacter zhuwentaonis TaxID=2837491 RepID=UPI001BDD5093|nr:glycosyltransferase family 4 protein [Canibacter zhuwentaonis]MBT1035550.1 glycosyltransferase family 4 protein [Canibacter zhuwentaonis]